MQRGAEVRSWLAALVLSGAASACSGERVEAMGRATAASAAPNEGTSASIVDGTPSGSAAPALASAEPAPQRVPAPRPYARAERVDLVLRGGLVVDGTGGASRVTDVLVHGGRIEHVGEVAAEQEATATLDLKGQVVAPGFVDLHAHADPLGPSEFLFAQGVTTILVGQDGSSPAERIGPFLDRVEAARPRLNVATLVGHATAATEARIARHRPATSTELERLRTAVARGLDEGAFGLSLGLEYEPGSLAGLDELTAAAEPVGARRGLVMAHLRSEDDDAIEASIAELCEIARRSGAKAHVAHLKIVLGRGEARAKAVLDLLERERRSGVALSADLYPYDASYTTFAILFPSFARPPHAYAEARRQRGDELRAWLRGRIEQRGGPEAMLLGTGTHAGKTLAELATSRGQRFEDVMVELGPNGGSAAYFVMDEAVVEALARAPFVAFGTDGGAGSSHPRAYGSFARVFARLVRERGALSLEEAVRKAARLPWQTLGLDAERGLVAPGHVADLVVFDPARFVDRASFVAPRLRAEGVSSVFVRGKLAYASGKLTKERAGAVLRAPARRAPATPSVEP
jgi:N-acyl-D-aspartate/D-glutamate deacylase